MLRVGGWSCCGLEDGHVIGGRMVMSCGERIVML